MLRSSAACVRAHRNGALIRKQIQLRFSTSAPASDIGPEHVDIVIVGGGPAGLSLACALSSSINVCSTLRIALIEGGDLEKVRSWSPRSDQFSNRVSSITNSSKDFLNDIGAWEHIDVSRTSPIEEMHVWDGMTDSRIVFSASDIPSVNGVDSLTEMAHLTENLNIQRALLRRLEKGSEVLLLDKNKVEGIRNEDPEGSGWPIVHLADGRRLRARLLVGADGFNSPVRSYADISTYGWSYDTQAIVATLSHAPRIRPGFQNLNTTAYQRFLPTGPIAFLPLSHTTSSLVWSMRPPLAAALLASDPDVVSTMVNAAFRLPELSVRLLSKVVIDSHRSGSKLSSSSILEEVKWREESHAIDAHSVYSSLETPPIGIPPLDMDLLPPIVTSIQSGTIASFPVRFNHADAYIGEGKGGRTVLVGDAAHTVHPLAGQGLNMGFADVQALARCIESAVLHGGDIGSHTSLLPYSRDRYFENYKLLSATDKLHKLYSSTCEPVIWARSVGLEVVNELSTIKSALMFAAGADGARAAKRDATAWNFAAGSVQALAEGYGLAKLLQGNVGSLASSVVAGVTHLTKKS